MIDRKEIEKMALLAQIALGSSEADALQKDLNQILEYVQKVEGREDVELTQSHKNVMREDTDPHSAGKWTKRLLEAAPNTFGNHIASQTILKND